MASRTLTYEMTDVEDSRVRYRVKMRHRSRQLKTNQKQISTHYNVKTTKRTTKKNMRMRQNYKWFIDPQAWWENKTNLNPMAVRKQLLYAFTR